VKLEVVAAPIMRQAPKPVLITPPPSKTVVPR